MNVLLFTLLSLFFAIGDEIMNGDNSVAAPTTTNNLEIRNEPQNTRKTWSEWPEK